ncbi:MAG: aquaporin [Chloroflexota bacterium]
MDSKKLIAEFIGTFALIFIGAGAGAVSGSLVAVALAHGLVIVAFAYSLGDISGIHINPAVTVGLASGGKISWGDAVGYIIAQLLGGIVGALLLAVVIGFPTAAPELGNTTLAAGVTPVQGVILEAVLTFFLVNTIYHSAVSGKAGNFAPLAIGLTLVFCILMGGNVTGASLNPARTIGPAIISAGVFPWGQLWLYIVGPVAGGVLAALVHRVLRD